MSVKLQSYSSALSSKRMGYGRVHLAIALGLSATPWVGYITGSQLVQSVQAAGCANTYASLHATYQKLASNIRGVKANIEVSNPYLCDPIGSNPYAFSGTSAWVMIDNNSATNFRYIQSGWMKYENAGFTVGPVAFAEYNTTGNINGYFTMLYNPVSAGQIIPTYVEYQSSCTNASGVNIGGCWTWAKADKAQGQYVLATKLASTFATRIEYSGETHDAADQMLGSISNPLDFTSMFYRNNATWQSPALSASDKDITHPRGVGSLSGTSGSAIKIHDSAY
jgi:hypothetical protein